MYNIQCVSNKRLDAGCGLVDKFSRNFKIFVYLSLFISISSLEIRAFLGHEEKKLRGSKNRAC